MLAVIRLVGLGLFFLYMLLYTLVVCIGRPFHRSNVQAIANALGRGGCWLMNISVELRIPDSIKDGGPYVFIANHQNSYDIFTLANAVLPGTVSVGKKSLKWIPVFGQIYWLSGNIMIDRKNSGKALNKLGHAVDKVRNKRISIWLFPEGTRSNGRGLLPFKTGAFHAASQADVPMVAVCASNNCGQIKLNQWNNGKVIIEMMPEQLIADGDKKSIRKFSEKVRAEMADKIAALDSEIASAKRA